MTPSPSKQGAWSTLRHEPQQFFRNLRTDFETRVLGPLLASRRAGNIAMFHVGRSGSAVLGRMLHEHPTIYWDGELYERHFVEQEARTGQTFESHGEDPIALLKKRMKRAGQRYFGCEVKFFHLDLLGITLEDYLVALDELDFTHYIVLERTNLLRKIISSIIAHETGSFHKSSTCTATQEQITINVEGVSIDRTQKSLLDYILDYQLRFKKLHTLLEGRNVLSLTYENDIEDTPLRAYERSCSFIGVDARELEPPYTRTNPYALQQLVTNVGDIRSALEGTEVEWMVSDSD